MRKRQNAELKTDQDLLNNLPDPNETDLDQQWDKEWRKHILTQAFAELRTRLEPKTFQAFELYTQKKWTPAKVADFLDISVSSVYTAKSRTIEHLREILKEQEEL